MHVVNSVRHSQEAHVRGFSARLKIAFHHTCMHAMLCEACPSSRKYTFTARPHACMLCVPPYTLIVAMLPHRNLGILPVVSAQSTVRDHALYVGAFSQSRTRTCG
jgi:hypothetical protein